MSGNVGNKPYKFRNPTTTEPVTTEPNRTASKSSTKEEKNTLLQNSDSLSHTDKAREKSQNQDLAPLKTLKQSTLSAILNKRESLPNKSDANILQSASPSRDNVKHALESYQRAVHNFHHETPVDFPEYKNPHIGPKYGSEKLKEATFVLSAIHDSSSTGSWHLGTKVARAMDEVCPKILEGNICEISSVSKDTRMGWVEEITKIQPQIIFLQKARLFLFEIKDSWGSQEYVFATQKIAVEHLALVILSKVQQGEPVALPLDFINNLDESNHAMVLGIAPSVLGEKPVVSGMTLSIYETNGVMSRRVMPYESRVRNTKSEKSLLLKKISQPSSNELIAPSAFVSPKAKIFSRTQLPPNLDLRSNIRSSKGKKDLPLIVEDLARWLTTGAPPKPQAVWTQIQELRKELRNKYNLNTPSQELQAIQKFGVCELKSLYSYLKHTLSPIAYALVRREIIHQAYQTLTEGSSEASESLATKVMKLSVLMAFNSRQEDESNNFKSFDEMPADLRDEMRNTLIRQAQGKLDRADKKIAILIGSASNIS